MQFAKLQRTLSEKAFTEVLNVSGATITTGIGVAYALGASNDGVNAVLANGATTAPGFLGVAVQDIANNDYGRVQIYGFVNSVLMSAIGTSVTVTQGDPLVPGVLGFVSAAPTYANSGFKYLSASNVPANTLSTASYASGLIRIL